MKLAGETLKTIRKNLSLTQSQIAEGVMTQSNYSKVEKGEVDISFSKMVSILGKLGMSVDEFLYVHNNYSKKIGSNLLNLNKLKFNDKNQLTQYKNELKALKAPTAREKELLGVYEALIIIADQNDYESAKQKVAIIWNRLEKYDSWYLYDIHLINNVLYLFPIDTAYSIACLALKRLEKYQNFRGVNNLSASIQMNLLLLLIENKRYETALKKTKTLISFCIEKNLSLHLAVCYVRKGLLFSLLDKEDAKEWYEKGHYLLDIMQNDALKKEIEKEILHYSNIE